MGHTVHSPTQQVFRCLLCARSYSKCQARSASCVTMVSAGVGAGAGCREGIPLSPKERQAGLGFR